MTKHRIRYSAIKNKWLRRPIMIAATPFMLLGNWIFVVLAIALVLPGMFWRSTIGTFDGFIKVWNGERVEDEVE